MATDVERLVVTIEVNTKPFINGMNALARQTDTAMGGVERSVRSSLDRQQVEFRKAGEHFAKELVKGFGINVGRGGIAGFAGLMLGNFISDSIKVAAEAGNQSAKIFLEQWSTVGQKLKENVGGALTAIWLANQRVLTLLGVPGGQLIEDQMTLLDTEKKRAELEARRTTVLTKNVQLTEQEVNTLEKANRLGYKEPAAPPTVKLGPLQAPGAEQLEAFDKVIRNLIFEEQQLGRTAEMQRVYNELKKAGVNIESGYGQAIQITAQRLHEEELQVQALKEVNDGLEASSKTFIQGLLDGQSVLESFSAALRKLADALLDLALHSLFNPGGTPLLQSLFGGALGLGQWGGGVLPGAGGATASVNNAPLGGASMRSGGMAPQFHTAINVSGSVDQKTLAAMDGMIRRNNQRQNAELQRNWGNMQSRYAALRGP